MSASKTVLYPQITYSFDDKSLCINNASKRNRFSVPVAGSAWLAFYLVDKRRFVCFQWKCSPLIALLVEDYPATRRPITTTATQNSPLTGNECWTHAAHRNDQHLNVVESTVRYAALHLFQHFVNEFSGRSGYLKRYTNRNGENRRHKQKHVVENKCEWRTYVQIFWT